MTQTDYLPGATDLISGADLWGNSSVGSRGIETRLVFQVLPMPSGRNESTAAFDYGARRLSGRLPLETRFDRGTHINSLAVLADAVKRSWPDALLENQSQSIARLSHHGGGAALSLMRSAVYWTALCKWLEQGKPVAVQSPTVRIPQTVVEFCAQQDLGDCLSSAVGLALRIFSGIQSLATRLQSDPDTDEERVVIDVTVDAPVDEVLAAKKAYTKTWVRTCPPAARDKIRLLYYMA